jgi:hypothetical protein
MTGEVPNPNIQAPEKLQAPNINDSRDREAWIVAAHFLVLGV